MLPTSLVARCVTALRSVREPRAVLDPELPCHGRARVTARSRHDVRPLPAFRCRPLWSIHRARTPLSTDSLDGRRPPDAFSDRFTRNSATALDSVRLTHGT